MINREMSVLGADESVVPESDVKVLKGRIRELERLLGRKTLENEVLKEAIGSRAKKNYCRARHCREGTVLDEDRRRPRWGCRGRT